MTKIRESNILGTLVTELKDVSSDTSPQLGGNLDLNSSDITGTGDINITGAITATSFSGTLNNVVEDLTPQLGGNLDTNSQNILIDDAHYIGDENGNEQLIFQTTGSAVNNLEIQNASTGNAPTLRVVGGDSNADLSISPKGTGRVVLGAGAIEQLTEKVTNGATAFTGTINFDVMTQALFRATSNASGNWTLNIRGNASNTLNAIMDTGESITIVTIIPMGGTGYYNSAVQVDGSSVTPLWAGGEAPTEGNASSNDVYTYTVIKTGNAAFAVYAAQTQFAS